MLCLRETDQTEVFESLSVSSEYLSLFPFRVVQRNKTRQILDFVYFDEINNKVSKLKLA